MKDTGLGVCKPCAQTLTPWSHFFTQEHCRHHFLSVPLMSLGFSANLLVRIQDFMLVLS